jgi:hypothetical protein
VSETVVLARTSPTSLGASTLAVPLAAGIAIAVGADIADPRELLGAAVLTVVLATGLIWWWGRNAVLADDGGPIVVTRGRTERPYRWSELVAAEWEPGAFWRPTGPGWGASLLVAPRGGPFDVPGPNNPRRLGSVMLVWPWERRAAQARAAAVVHRFMDCRHPDRRP